MVERFHRWMNCQLTIFSNAQRNDWDEHIDSILYAYRTSTHLTTGYTPFELLLGRRANMVPNIIYELENNQVEDERRLGANISDTMSRAYQHVRRADEKAARLRNKRRDDKRVAVEYQKGDLVFLYDEQADKSTKTKKLRYRLDGPFIVESDHRLSPNIYSILDPTSGRREKTVNVNRLIPAYHDMGDLGDPLGWKIPSQDDINSAFSSENTPRVISNNNYTIPLNEGDMVCLHVEPDAEGSPFAVGKIYNIEDDSIKVHWYGHYSKSPVSSSWQPGFCQSDGRPYYGNRRHKSHNKFTSVGTECELTRSHIIGPPFTLTKTGRIPMRVLRAVSDSPLISWELAKPMQTKEYSQACAAILI
jgi:hypothetical protein